MNAPYPEWLVSQPDPTHAPRTAVRDLRLFQLDNLFENSLPALMEGVSLPVLLRNDPRGIRPGEFLRWVFKDADRRSRYYEALAIGAEIVFSEVLDISDAAENPMEDVQRSKLRIDTRKWWMSVANRSRFGDIKKLDVTTQTITEDSLRELSINDLKRMVVSGRYVQSDITDDEVIVE